MSIDDLLENHVIEFLKTASDEEIMEAFDKIRYERMYHIFTLLLDRCDGYI